MVTTAIIEPKMCLAFTGARNVFSLIKRSRIIVKTFRGLAGAVGADEAEAVAARHD
jgi:hypothetical protein